MFLFDSKLSGERDDKKYPMKLVSTVLEDLFEGDQEGDQALLSP
jgi:hypothetical protein